MSRGTDWESRLGFDRVPSHIIDKRVTEVMSLAGRKAIITGAGGDGLGQAVANRLAGLGADVALIGRTYAKVERRADEVRQRWGVRAVPILADLSVWDQVHRAVDESQAALGGLDIMINNPVYALAGTFADFTQEMIDDTVHGSLTMLMYGAHAALEHMIPQASGKIINISAAAGRTAPPGLVVYAAAKSGVIGFTRNLAAEVADLGIHVLGCAPGIMVKPDLLERILNPKSAMDRAARQSVMESLAHDVRLKRVSIPEEVANIVAFLASDAASYMCGQTIDASGGQYMN
ncbi:SDR family NAD(P)-dependent oxidoreductase [Candidatus Poriferisocius sp.]|uniref:SDR family NAD(P)-dependent oxidoreductase n=1 Tax=Candidatus Poriferisocius sp. TaxID=3101276 RepID=UPI003B5CC114